MVDIDSVLQAKAFIEDFIDPIVERLQVASAPKAANASLSLQIVLLRENLGWLDAGLRVGYFELDRDAYNHASVAAQQYALWRPVVRGAPEMIIENSFFQSSLVHPAGALRPSWEIGESSFWLSRYNSVLRPYTQWPRAVAIAYEPAQIWNEFAVSLAAAKADSRPEVMDQMFVLYFARDAEWREWEFQIERAISQKSFQRLNPEKPNSAWLFTESSLAKGKPELMTELGDSSVWPNPADWRSETPWRQPLGLEYVNLNRRSAIFSFLVAFVEDAIQRDDLDVEERVAYEQLLEKLRGQALITLDLDT
ncbi:hypothetical protein SAMN04515671_1360 [Nakamurella panacisegetis]|uniref:Uncharacterized protein n=1 Tax=Nakamurella panacisegetis TaxID=1090615 RepID=A0A1H0KLT7_9ACTN|nr:hypothetical protein [Nakamurella panacisegetis]SDO56888.1 hypothetical protein SAMN04515671_1360 [Nakamurella panacisegetis]